MDPVTEKMWKQSFFKDNFNVDHCLSKYTLKTDLESLRNDLKNYGNELHQQMSEILKTETEAIVNLAEYLTNLNSNIDDLSLPISQLREEIKTLYDLINNALRNYHKSLENIKNNNNNYNYLNLKLGITTSALYINEMMRTNEDDLFDDSIVLERVVNKFSFEFNYLEAFGLVSDMDEISSVGKKLTELVNKVFLKSIKNKDENILLRSLRMYENLGEQKKAEQTYQIHVVRPKIQHLFNDSHLESCHQNIDIIYNDSLTIIEPELTILSKVLENNPELKSFNFVLNSLWLEIDKQLREGLPNITAPGNPEMFQKRFKSTYAFLETIANKSGDVNLIHTNSNFKNHIKRFNLPVYFEIRFQQIAAKFENVAIVKFPSVFCTDSNDIDCFLKITLALWRSLKFGFAPDVFIDNLSDQFIKLLMLLLARYLKWFEMILNDNNSANHSWEDFIIKAIIDLKIVKKIIGYKSAIFNIVPKKFDLILLKVCDLNCELIQNIIIKLENNLIEMKRVECLSHLQNVGAIPRLYRRTNRSVPKEASHYMVEALQPIIKFNETFKKYQHEEIAVIVDSVIAKSSKQFQNLVDEVLRSVCKTEESLRRLKNRNVQVTEDGEMSDEMKIREQIRLDVYYFVENLTPLAQPATCKLMDELKRQTC